ncbi:MAG TPA: hypothetical protein VMB71_01720 [Acetobacteraceae bacterium]|nr:hypothetical protein [Acetobacteraceae bacterium]
MLLLGSLKRTLLRKANVIGLAALTAPGLAAAHTQGIEYYIAGAGTGMITTLQPCPDIQCNSGDTCTCVTASGSLKARNAIDGKKFFNGTYTMEISSDYSTGIDNGARGRCWGTTGYFTVTFPKGKMTLPWSGLACTVPRTQDQMTFGITAPVAIGSGTGIYNNASGAGSFSGTFSPTSGNLVFNVLGLAVLFPGS